MVPKLFDTKDYFSGRQFSHALGMRIFFGLFKHIIFIMHFISVIITSAPPQIIRH